MVSAYRRPSPRVKETDTFWTERSPSTRHAACLGILLIIAASFYAPVLLEGKTIVGSDRVNFQAVSQATVEHYEQTGEWPRWAPNVFSGMPYVNYKNVIPQVDDLVSQLRGNVWPVAHLFVLMVGVYLLVFYLTRNHLSGLLSGIAFGFTTYIPIILAVGHNTKFIALAYAPYVLLAFVYTLRNPSLLGGLLFAGALSLQLRPRHPQIVYYVMVVIGLWWLVEVIRAVREDRTRQIATSTGWLALGTGLGLLMAAQPYLATYEYKEFSVRGAEAASTTGGTEGGGMGWSNAMQWSQGPKELFTLLVAEAFGGGGQLYWGPKTFTEGPHYVGGVVMALAGLAVWRVRSWVTWGLGVGTLATILFSLGRHASWINWPMFQYFPFFDAFRAPETWLSVSALGLAVLAGIGLDYALRRDSSRQRKRHSTDSRRTSILTAFGVVFGLVALVWMAPNTLLDFEKPNEEQRMTQMILQQNPNVSPQNPQLQQAVRQQMQKLKEERRDAFVSDAQRTLLFLFLAGGALLLYRRNTVQAWVAGLVVVGLVTVDLWGVDKRYLGADQYSEDRDAEDIIPMYRFDQYLTERMEEAGGDGHFRVLSLAEGNPSNTARPSYYYESIGGYHGAKLQRYQDYLDHILRVSQSGRPNDNALDMMNARYIVAREQLPGTEVVYRGEESGVLVLENPDAVPRGFLVGQTEVVEGPEETWSRLRDESFDPRTTALLPEPLEAPVAPIEEESTAEVELEDYEPERIEWTIQTDAPRLFVASEVYYPAGWNAYLDGEQVPIHRVNYLLRGVHVPEGEHTLEMRFEPKTDRYSVWISGISTVLVYGGIVGILGMRYRRRRERENDEVEKPAE